jgi:hypothetical protein
MPVAQFRFALTFSLTLWCARGEWKNAGRTEDGCAMLSLQNLTRVKPVSGAALRVPETIGTIDTPEF